MGVPKEIKQTMGLDILVKHFSNFLLSGKLITNQEFLIILKDNELWRMLIAP